MNYSCTANSLLPKTFVRKKLVTSVLELNLNDSHQARPRNITQHASPNVHEREAFHF